MTRFSLRALLLAVAFVALAIVATKNANYTWLVALEMLAYLFLFTAIVGAIFARGERRAFWIGCAIFGWGFWLAGALSSYVRLPGWRVEDVVAEVLIRVFPAQIDLREDEYLGRIDVQHMQKILDWRDGNNVAWVRLDDVERVQRLPEVTRALLVIVAGVIGGVVAGWFYRSRHVVAAPHPAIDGNRPRTTDKVRITQSP
jgi:hypothetical protein